MPMNATVLAADIKARLNSKMLAAVPAFAAIQADMDAFLTAISEAAAEATVEHISTFAQVDGIVVVVTSVGGVTTGPGTSGPGTGTATAAPGSIT